MLKSNVDIDLYDLFLYREILHIFYIYKFDLFLIFQAVFINQIQKDFVLFIFNKQTNKQF